MNLPSHVGLATRDLEVAMATLGSSFRVSWGPVADTVEPGLAAPDQPVDWALRRCHSEGGSFGIELLEGSPGSIWDTDEVAELHHLAYWSDDVAAEIDRLVAEGWRLEATLRDAHGQPREFAYLARPGDVRVELVASHRRGSE